MLGGFGGTGVRDPVGGPALGACEGRAETEEMLHVSTFRREDLSLRKIY